MGPILLYNVRCTGSERRLVDCPSGSYHYGIRHSNDAGVRCQINPSPGNSFHPAEGKMLQMAYYVAFVFSIVEKGLTNFTPSLLYVQSILAISERFVLLEETVPVKDE